jgi:protein TonB
VSDAVFDGTGFSPADLRPSWLRPATIAIVLALHGAALFILPALRQSPADAPREVVVDIETPAPAAKSAVPPEPAPVPNAPPEAAQPEAPPPLTESSPVPESPLPNVVAPPLESPPPVPAELTLPPPPPPPRVDPKAGFKPEPKPAPKPVPKTAERTEKALQSSHEAAPKLQAAGKPVRGLQGAPAEGTRPPAAAGNAEQQSGYIAEISAAIRNRLAYPAAARARGAKGVVGVAFTIAVSGAVTSFAITRSSGDPDLDSAARTLVLSARFPPPPAGPVHIATNFNYIPR